MARLPQVGGDQGNWGDILNEYLSVSLDPNGSIRASSVDAAKIATANAPTSGSILGWDGAHLNWQTPTTSPVASVSGKTGNVTLMKSDVGLANVDNTSDAAKPVSISMQSALDSKVGTNDTRLTDSRIPLDGSVSTSKIQNEAVTEAKLAPTLLTRFTDAQTAATNANNSAASASNSATTANTSASNASASAGNASTSASDAATSATNASTSATNASSAKTAAESARDETIVAVDGQSSWTGTVSLTAVQSKSKYVRRLLTGNVTVTVAAGESGKAYSCSLELQQDSTGSRAIILANVVTPYGVALPLSTTANNVDILRLEWNGTRWAGYVAGPQMSIPTAWVV